MCLGWLLACCWKSEVLEVVVRWGDPEYHDGTTWTRPEWDIVMRGRELLRF